MENKPDQNELREQLDITEEELRQQTDELAASRRAAEMERQRYQMLFQFAPDGYLVTDRWGKIQQANRAAATLLNVPQDVLAGKLLILYVAGGYAARRAFRNRLTELQQSGAEAEIRDWEVQIEPRAGVPFPAVLTVAAIGPLGLLGVEEGDMPSAEAPAGLLWLIRDVTQQRQFEESLQASTQRYQSLFESALDAILLTDNEGCYVDANPAACQLLGYERESLLGLCIWDITPAPDLSEAQRQWQAFLEAGEQQGEITLVCREGQRIEAEYRAVANVLPGLHLSVMRDVTERKRTEEALKRSERELRMMADNVPVLFSYVDAEGRYRFVNRQYEVWFGLSWDEIVGRHYSEILGEEASAKLEGRIETVLAGRRIRYEDELPYARGGSRWVVAEYVPDVDEEGKVHGLFAVVTDISEQREAREALMRSLQETAHAEQSLLSVSQAAQEVQRARTPEEVYHAIGRAAQELGFEAMVLNLSEHETKAVVAHLTFDADLLQAAVELTGVPVDGYRFRLEPEGILQRTLEEPDPVYVTAGAEFVAETLPREVRSVAPDLEALFDVGQHVIAPLRIQGRTRALMIVMGQELGEVDVPAIAAFANQAAIALENAELYQAERAAREELRNLAGYLEAGREEERTRIAREIHDEFGQVLTALKMDVAWLARRLPADDSRLADKTEIMSDLIDATVRQVRRIATDLRPGVLDDLGLAAAIEWQTEDLAKRTGLAYELKLSRQDLALDPELATALFRIFQEALTNVVRHADASRVWVTLAAEPDQIVLTVRDDGRGITPQEVSATDSLGLTGMRERARLWGGEIEFAGEPRQGTTITVRVPGPAGEGRSG